jgi:hypothetical protein
MKPRRNHEVEKEEQLEEEVNDESPITSIDLRAESISSYVALHLGEEETLVASLTKNR